MASKSSASVSFLVVLNLVLFALSGPAAAAGCPRDALNLGVCLNLLNGLIDVHLGTPPAQPCCSLLYGLADLEAAVCLCTVLNVNALGLINLPIPIDVSLILNYCGMSAPTGFQC